MINLSNKLITGVLIFGSFLFGDMARKIYFPPLVATEQTATVLTDNLSLTNDSKIVIESVNSKKMVKISLEEI